MTQTQTEAGTRARPGRPRVDTIPAERKRHLKALAGREIFRLSYYDLALLADRHHTTIRNWVRLAKGYPEARSRYELMLAAAD